MKSTVQPDQLFAPTSLRGQERDAIGPDRSGASGRPAGRAGGATSGLVWGLLCVIAGAFVAGAWAGATEVEQRFDAANRLYEQGRFTDAVAAYEQLLAQGRASAALYFNLGNAQFKAGRLGHAIVAYRKAERMAPRDPDLRANLKFAREQVVGPSLRAGWPERLLGAVSLNEWSGLAAAALWVWFALLAAGGARPAWRSALRLPTWGAALATLLLCGALGLQLRAGLSAPTAVVLAGEVAVHNGPFDESPVAFTVRDGAELRVLDRKADWLQVTPGGGRMGWVAGQHVQVLSIR